MNSDNEQNFVVTNADGRVLAGKVFGPADGAAVLFIAGAGTGKSMFFGAEFLAARGIRLVCMDRPGMGGSDADGARTVASTAGDYRDFAAAVLDSAQPRLPVVANSQGALFGLAAALNGVASSLTLVSPADEVTCPAIRALLPESALHLPDLVRTEPGKARELLESLTPQDMEDMVLAGATERDRFVYQNPEFRRRYREALREGFAGPGYVTDTVMAMSPWPLELGDIRIRVTVLFGAGDRTHSPDQGATLTARIPGATREVVAGEGGSLLWARSDHVLDVATRP